jgi:hypothetical protein
MDNCILALNFVLLIVILYYIFPLKSLLNSILGKEIISMEALDSLFNYTAMDLSLFF